MTNELVARFRQVALDRIERVEQDWNALVQGGVSAQVPLDLRRELHTLKSEAQVVAFDEVSLVCHKLEEMTATAERLSYRVPQDLDLLVMMAIRFVVLLARKQSGRPLAGIDLDGFVRQVDDVLAEVRQLSTPVAPAAPGAAAEVGAMVTDRLSARARRRIGRAAVLAFVESVRATGSARQHLREVWQILSDELSSLGTALLAPRVRLHARQALDLAREIGKSVDIAVDVPPDLRVSPEVADALDTALLHLLRNAIDHGIESGPTRRAAGKKVPGTITIRCEDPADEGELTLVVEDDGAGVDLAAVRRRAIELGLLEREAEPGSSELLDLLFHAGFTTRREATALSGRGIGLDAVRSTLETLGGAVSLRTGEGHGSSFRLRAPQAAGTLAVHVFTACGGLDLPLAVSAAWSVAPVEDSAAAIDPLASLGADLTRPSPPGGFALRLTRGRFDLCWRAVGPVLEAQAERIGAPLDDQPAEVVRIDGREALLLRPELS